MKRLIIAIVIGTALYSRLVGVSWGLPYPMHPDERNMAVAVQSLKLSENLNPHFFAYGQLPLYIAYVFIQISNVVLFGKFANTISFESATIALRYISVLSSWASLWIIYRILRDFFSDYIDRKFLPFILIPFIFSPYAIQFAHFGTTESLLTSMYLGILYVSLRIGITKVITTRSVLLLGIIGGLSIGTKISSATFLGLPIVVIVWVLLKTRKKMSDFMMYFAKTLMILSITSMLFSLIASPHMLLSPVDFLSSITYESKIASGAIQVFYTRQFLYSIPIVYQLVYIFPVALGMGVYLLFFGGFFLLSWKDSRFLILRSGFLLYFIPSSLLFVKWTRFEAPVLPIAAIVGILFLCKILFKIHKSKVRFALLVIALLLISIHGFAYLSVYRNVDVRFQASEWMFKNIPEQARVFSEAGNVINIPVPVGAFIQNSPNLSVVNFDFYQVDYDNLLQKDLTRAMQESNYIVVPSRRIMGSVTCSLPNTRNSIGYASKRCSELMRLFPVTNEYYDKLLSGELGYSEIKRFTAYPKIEVFGKTLIEFPDEQYDETWSVFDHPVIRIYKRT